MKTQGDALGYVQTLPLQGDIRYYADNHFFNKQIFASLRSEKTLMVNLIVDKN